MTPAIVTPLRSFGKMKKRSDYHIQNVARRKRRSLLIGPSGMSKSSGKIPRHLNSASASRLSDDTASRICERHSVLEGLDYLERPGADPMQMHGCRLQGLAMPQRQITDYLLPPFRDTQDSPAAADTFLKDYANEQDELRWAVTPNLTQHVDSKSFHRVDMPFDYNFEKSNPAQLTLEHLAYIDELYKHFVNVTSTGRSIQ